MLSCNSINLNGLKVWKLAIQQLKDDKIKFTILNLLFRFSKKTEFLCLVWFFSFSQFSPVKIIILNKKFLYLIEDIDFLSSNVKRYFTSDSFCKVLEVWKLPNLPYSGLNYERFEVFVHNAESVTQIIYAWRIIPHNKIVPNWIEIC